VTTVYRDMWTLVDGVRTLVTAELCRDRIAELETELNDAALLPDTMGTGRRSVSRGRQREALAARLAVWNHRLYRLTGGAEGSLLGCRITPV